MKRVGAEREPAVDAALFIADGAVIVGDVVLGEGASVFYNAVIRGDLERITIGAEANIQDGCVIHADPDFPVRVGSGVTVGHRAVLHGTVVGDGAMVGIGAVLLNGSVVGNQAIVAAGAVVPEGMNVPPKTVALGCPARVKRSLRAEELAQLRENAVTYLELGRAHQASRSRSRRTGAPTRASGKQGDP